MMQGDAMCTFRLAVCQQMATLKKKMQCVHRFCLQTRQNGTERHHTLTLAFGETTMERTQNI